MKKIWPYLVLGVVLVLTGLVWTLQGFDLLQGSAMSGSSVWATVGPIVLVVGLVLIAVAVARRRSGTS